MEPVETINQRLIDHYGKDIVTGNPNFRIVFSDDQFEKRWVEHSREGFQLLNKRVEERPKYRQYIQSKYLIERLTIVPEFVETDLLEKVSYEPLWVFEDRYGNPLPPKWEVCEIVIDQVHRAAAGAVGKKVDEESKLMSDPKIAPEVRLARIKRIEEELFGNETPVGDALAIKTGIVVPGPQQENKQ